MKLFTFALLAGLLMPILPASAQSPEDAAAAAAAPPAQKKEKSAKKKAADSNKLNLPSAQVLEEKDFLLGLRVNRGDAYGGSTIFGINGEYLFSSNFGLIGQVYYGSYGNTFAVGPLSGGWDYKVWVLSAMGTLHADFLKAPNFDPYVSIGLGRTIYSVKVTTNIPGMPEPAGVESGSFFIQAYLNFRYFIDSKWALQASIGTGNGLLSLGADYVF